jgi:5-hydroxyisourate hydrolase-like protein (transthyretin family)
VSFWGLRASRTTRDNSGLACHPCMRRFLLLAITLSVAAACGSDNGGPGSTGPGPTSTTPYSVSADSATLDRTAPIGSFLTTSVLVELNGQPAVGVTVNWIPTKNNGTVSVSTSQTDATGMATVVWRISDTAQVNTLTATAGTGSVNVTATGTPGAATTLIAGSADSTGLVAGASTLITVHAADSFGNAVPGVPINWSASGGLVTPLTSTTGATGNASIVFITTSTPATYSVTATATAPGLPALSFKVVGF